MKTLPQHLHNILEKAAAFPWNEEAVLAFETAVKEALRDQRHRCAEQACEDCQGRVHNIYLGTLKKGETK